MIRNLRSPGHFTFEKQLKTAGKVSKVDNTDCRVFADTDDFLKQFVRSFVFLKRLTQDHQIKTSVLQKRKRFAEVPLNDGYIVGDTSADQIGIARRCSQGWRP